MSIETRLKNLEKKLPQPTPPRKAPLQLPEDPEEFADSWAPPETDGAFVRPVDLQLCEEMQKRGEAWIRKALRFYRKKWGLPPLLVAEEPTPEAIEIEKIANSATTALTTPGSP